MDCSLPGSSIYGILQARVLEWVAIAFSSNAGDLSSIPGPELVCWRKDRLPTPVFLGFPCGSAGKESACNVEDLGLIPGLGRPSGEGKGYSLQYSGLENPWGCKELDRTERLSISKKFHSEFCVIISWLNKCSSKQCKKWLCFISLTPHLRTVPWATSLRDFSL